MKLTEDQIAESLNLPAATVRRWIRQGKLPTQTINKAAVIGSGTLKKWAEARKLPFTPPLAEKSKDRRSFEIGLSQALRRGGVYHGVAATDVFSALEAAVGFAPDCQRACRKILHEKLMEREALSSTGIGGGVAIPHPRTPPAQIVKNPLAMACFLENPIDFKAIDDQPVYVLFLLLSPATHVHLQLLSRLSFLLRNKDFMRFLKTAPPADALCEKIAKLEPDL